jgi:hypothetical protein
LAVEQRPKIEDGFGAGNFENVAGWKERRALYAEGNEVNGWAGKERQGYAFDFDFFAGGLFKVGDDLRAVAIEVEPEWGEENYEDECGDECGEGAKDDFAARGHAR